MASVDDSKELKDKKSSSNSALKKFAQNARRQLLEQVAARLAQVLADGSLERRESAKAVAKLEQEIAESSREQVIERVAYTWFNRFCALRYMDANRVTKVGIVSPSEGFHQPEILMEAKQGHIEDDWKVDKQRVLGLLDRTLPSRIPEQEAYRVLLVAACNYFHKVMPFMFEKIADYTELLIPDDLLSDNSVLTDTRNTLTTDNCQEVEVIGWLFQYYITEKKNDVIGALKASKKITPENIPAATQLFTPHWIVRYLVENSLGRLWMLNHPSSKLIDKMDYYIKSEQPETDFLKISSPEEIKICDPACGSGHMLTYAFELLYAIYEEKGYQATEIPRLILQNNLYGVEIDQRAGALAAFALTMKARDKYRRFLQPDKVVQPNICVLENIQIDPDDLSAYMDKVGREMFSGGLQGVVNQWEEADNFGSLICPLVSDVSETIQLLREHQTGDDLFLAEVHQKVLKALRQAHYLSPKYHVVVANPPYLGNKAMNSHLTMFLKKHLKAGRVDLMAAFIVRSIPLTIAKGYSAIVTLDSWMFLSSFSDCRKALLSRWYVCSLLHIGWNCFPEGHKYNRGVGFIIKNHPASSATTFMNLSDVPATTNKDALCIERIATRSCVFTLHQNEIRSFPDNVFAYWLSDDVRQHFLNTPALKQIGTARIGLQTGDNARFVREWHEVSLDTIGFETKGREEVRRSTKKWFPYNKGGSYRKWYGNHTHVVNWENDGHEIIKYQEFLNSKKPKSSRMGIANNSEFYFKRSISWSKVTSGGIAFRSYPPGFIFDVAGTSLFIDESDHLLVLGLLNSSIVKTFVEQLNPTLNFEVGRILETPIVFPVGKARRECEENVVCLVKLHKLDWNAKETSWDFEQDNLVKFANRNSVAEALQGYLQLTEEIVSETKYREQLNNTYFVNAYAVSLDDSPEDSTNITLNCNRWFRQREDDDTASISEFKTRAIKGLISYAVGCMMGRYSLDKPGLILANQGETADDYRRQVPSPTFAPDEDNVIPLLDGDWFTDDISERFKQFLKVTFGADNYEENLEFLENTLYPENLIGKKRKTVRHYFLKDFYDSHNSMREYKKRPIYWLFSSPRGTFNALIYMHRYRPDTVSTVLGYLRDFILKLNANVEHLQSVADGTDASKSEKAKALKQITSLKKDIKELNDYEHNVLFPLASQQIEIDLDDGVKVNYNKFGSALKKVTGLSGN